MRKRVINASIFNPFLTINWRGEQPAALPFLFCYFGEKLFVPWKSSHLATRCTITITAKNNEISPHFLLFALISHNFPMGMEISVSVKFPIETCPFPLNFHPRTMHI